jgi:hypothetical protein
LFLPKLASGRLRRNHTGGPAAALSTQPQRGGTECRYERTQVGASCGLSGAWAALPLTWASGCCILGHEGGYRPVTPAEKNGIPVAWKCTWFRLPARAPR